jgi:hypothetical protein
MHRGPDIVHLSDFVREFLDLVHRILQSRRVTARHALASNLPVEVADRAQPDVEGVGLPAFLRA